MPKMTHIAIRGAVWEMQTPTALKVSIGFVVPNQPYTLFAFRCRRNNS